MDFYSIARHPGEYAGLIPVAADTVVNNGGLVARDASGNAVDAESTVVGTVVGRSSGGADNTGGAAGDVSVLCEKGVFALELDGTNPPTKAHIGKTVYAITPDTVAHTGTCAAGKLLGFDADGRAIVGIASGFVTTVALTSTNGTAAAAADLAALKTEAEKIGDDVRAIHAALVTAGIITAG